MANSLVEIRNLQDLLALQNLYKSNRPKSYIGYLTLGNYIGFFKQDPNVKHIRVYCLNGDYSDGTFVVTDRNRGYADTLDDNFENLYHLLQLIDYSTGYRFLAVRPDVRSIINTSLREIHVDIVSDNGAILYYLPKEQALKFDVIPPDDIQLKSITNVHDMEIVSHMWKHQDASSYPYVQRLVKFNQHIGAFKEDGTLVAWILRLPIGIVGGLQTDSNYYGRGYGSLVTRALAKQISEMGDDVYAAVYPDNTASHSLFKKLGFEPVGEVFFPSTKISWSAADE